MKRFFSLLVSMLMMVCLLAACGSDTSTPSSSADNSVSEPSDANSNGSTNDGDVTTLVWYQIGTQPGNLTEGMEIINEYLREKINVEVDFRMYDWGDWESGVTNMLNTGEYYDITFIHTRFFTSFAQQGHFYDLSSLLDTAPALTDLIPENIWPGVTIKGGVYGVPTYKDCGITQYIAFDNAIVEKYNIDLDAIQSLYDLDPILREIKAGEEAETGETVYPLPLTSEGVSALRMYYDNYVRYDDASGAVMNTWEREEMAGWLELIHSWWEDGIINPDASTVGDPEMYRICFIVQAFEGAEVSLSADRGYDIVMSPYTETVFSTESIQGSVNAISANSNHPAEALKLLELVNTDPYLRNLFAFGVPGEDWEDNGDGTINKLTDTWTVPAYSVATFFTMSPVSPNGADQWTKVQAQNDAGTSHVLLGFTFDDTNVESDLVNVNAVLEKYYPELLTGAYQGTTADFLEKMNKELYDAGLQAVLDETQAQIDEFLAK